MLRLIARKLLLILILLPLLNALGFCYAFSHPGSRQAWSTDTVPTPGETLEHYTEYARGVIRGDLGDFDGTPITSIIAEPLRNSLILMGAALAIAVISGPVLGVFSVSRRTRRIRSLALILSTFGLSMPGFFLGVVVLSVIVYGTLYSMPWAGVLPLSGFGFDRHLILPVLVLASQPTLQIARITAGLLEQELQQDYVRVGQSKGLSWHTLFWRHAFRNIISPVVVAMGQSARMLIGGLIIVETLFIWPGIGRLFLQDVGIRTDGRGWFRFFAQPELLAALIVVFGAWLLLTDFAASILTRLLDPRLRQPTGGGSAA